MANQRVFEPYASNADLPQGVRSALPAHAQSIYRNAFNNAHKQYGGDEERSHQTAWAAVKKKYVKGPDGKWHRKKGETQDGMAKRLPKEGGNVAELIDQVEAKLEIYEVLNEATGEKAHRVRFLTSRAEERNRNDRVYPLAIWQREAARINSGEVTVVGQSQHPGGGFFWGGTNPLDQFLHWDRAEMHGNDFQTEAEVLETSKGKDFIVIAKKTPQILTVSTRGKGSGKREMWKDGKEAEIIQMDYQLVGIDVIFAGEQGFGASKLMQFEMVNSAQAQAEAEKRREKYGIGVYREGVITPAYGLAGNEDIFGDPVNFLFPLSPAVAAQDSLERFNGGREAAGNFPYTETEWQFIGERIAKAQALAHEFKDGQIVPTQPLPPTVEPLPVDSEPAGIPLGREPVEGITLEALQLDEGEIARVTGLYERTIHAMEIANRLLETELATLRVQADAADEHATAADQALATVSEQLAKAQADLAAVNEQVVYLQGQRVVREHLVKKAQDEKFSLPLITHFWNAASVADIDAGWADACAVFEARYQNHGSSLRARLQDDHAAQATEAKKKPQREPSAAERKAGLA